MLARARSSLVSTCLKQLDSLLFLKPTIFAANRFDFKELWLPVMVPTHSTSIDLSVWHKEITGRDVVAHAYFDFNAVAAMPGKPAGGGKRCACVVCARKL